MPEKAKCKTGSLSGKSQLRTGIGRTIRFCEQFTDRELKREKKIPRGLAPRDVDRGKIAKKIKRKIRNVQFRARG